MSRGRTRAGTPIGLPARWCLAIGASTWAGAISAQTTGPTRIAALTLCVAGCIVAVRSTRTWWLVGLFVVLGGTSGVIALHRGGPPELTGWPSGTHDVAFTIVEEPTRRSFGLAIAAVDSIDGESVIGVRAAVAGVDTTTIGTRVVGPADIRMGVRDVAGEVVPVTLHMTDEYDTHATRHLIVAAGNAVRRAVIGAYPGDHRANALISGFLIGYTDEMPTRDVENMRLSGLSHFTAVSGSNVALFLVLWWFVTAPLSIHRRLRVVVGMVGLWLFTIVTRWEASVVRAAVMAAVPLVGGWLSIPVDPWMALGTAVTVLLLVSAHLALELGFQLSVLATAGVLIGLAFAKGMRGPRWIVIPLTTTLGAQTAVAPLLLATFGSVPLLAPIANLVAAPIVAATTVVGALGVAIPALRPLARLGASVVLEIADLFDGGPHLGWIGLAVTGVLVGLALHRVTRPLGLVLGVLCFVGVLGVDPVGWPPCPFLTVLDIGQGDAILVQDPSGASLLVDGGADPRRLDRALRRTGVPIPSAVLVTHGDNDHVGGLADLILETDQVFVSEFSTDLPIAEVARDSGIVVTPVSAGDQIAVGDIRLLVLSPARRYLSDNDGSVVTYIDGPRSALLPGDAEAMALRDLPPVDPDVLIAPHHGSGSTDRRWLGGLDPEVAVLSYGPNRYGHPHPEILAILTTIADHVLATAENGDIAIPLSASC